MKIEAGTMNFQELNRRIRDSRDEQITITRCFGQRYIGSGLAGRTITIEGTPGNALGSYLDGSTIRVYGNAQDATGDTMNDGRIYVHGRCGDALGYAMRGGRIYIKNSSGYRTGIHMKAYQEKVPVIIIGGKTGSFLGEYQAGGLIVVLNLAEPETDPVGYFCGTGMHGGKIYLRCKTLAIELPSQVEALPATEEDLAEIRPYVQEFCEEFSEDADFDAEAESILASDFLVLRPNTKNPYKKLYANK